MVETDLYFGQSKPDGSMVTESEWKNFKGNQIAKVFKEGSTVINGTGNWYDPVSHKLITEPTYAVYLLRCLRRLFIKIDNNIGRFCY